MQNFVHLGCSAALWLIRLPKLTQTHAPVLEGADASLKLTFAAGSLFDLGGPSTAGLFAAIAFQLHAQSLLSCVSTGSFILEVPVVFYSSSVFSSNWQWAPHRRRVSDVTVPCRMQA